MTGKTLLFFFVFSFFGTKPLYSLNIPAADKAILCDYGDFVARGENDRMKALREELYIQLIGALDILGEYRQQFLTKGNLIDLFPTAYYHTTLSEMKDIVSNDFKYPVEKMSQMIAFFDAYQRNRVLWDSGQKSIVEPHWEKHFYEAGSAFSNIMNVGCSGIPFALKSGIEAHVIYDLPRAIRYAFEKRKNTALTESDLIGDFNKTDRIFPQTNKKTKEDISKIRNCAVWWQNTGEFFFGGLFKTDGDVIKMRKAAWQKAHDGTPIKGIHGYDLGDQPFTNHSELTERGKSLCNPNKQSTLFLFDLSGSMNDFGGGSKPKIQQAMEASKTTLDAMRSGNQGVVNQVAVYGFRGACSPDPTVEIAPFTSKLDAVEQSIFQMSAGGGTPLANALRAAECKMAAHLQKEGQQKGKMIILSDGQGTCGSIRPAGVYNSAPLQRNRSVVVDANQCGFSNSSRVAVSYYTIGFNIPPGSPAERDLQYLSQISGGKYLNVQNQIQLARAFRKFNRTYQPKEYPALPDLPGQSVSQFSEGVAQIKDDYFKEALDNYEHFYALHPEDCHGAYNLALMQEANDFYKDAISSYEKYLQLCPNASDKVLVENQIKFLREEFREFVLFQKEVVRSDLEFLNLHFQRIQSGQSVALAEEFKGFLIEKGDYYEQLPRLIASTKQEVNSLSNDLVSFFQQCAKLIRRNPHNWDRDAVPVISMAFLSLEDLLETM